MGRGGVGSPGLDQPAIRVVACQAPGAVEHGQGPIRIFMDPHRDFHIMEPVGVLRDLEALAVRVDGVILGHDSLLLHTQDLGEIRADPRDEGGAWFRRSHHKSVVVLREEPLGPIPVGRRHLRNPSQGQLFG